MTIQTSLLPDERPDQYIPEKQRRRSVRAGVRRYIKSEGIYNYALMAKEVLQSTDEYLTERFKLSRAEVKTLLYSEFALAVAHQEDLDSYLFKVQTIPGFGLKKPKKNEINKPAKKR